MFQFLFAYVSKTKIHVHYWALKILTLLLVWRLTMSWLQVCILHKHGIVLGKIDLDREWVSIFLKAAHVNVFRLDSPVTLGATFLGTFWSSLAAQTCRSTGPSNPDRLQSLRWLLEGELHGLTFSEAAEALHVQFALYWETMTFMRF